MKTIPNLKLICFALTIQHPVFVSYFLIKFQVHFFWGKTRQLFSWNKTHSGMIFECQIRILNSATKEIFIMSFLMVMSHISFAQIQFVLKLASLDRQLRCFSDFFKPLDILTFLLFQLRSSVLPVCFFLLFLFVLTSSYLFYVSSYFFFFSVYLSLSLGSFFKIISNICDTGTVYLVYGDVRDLYVMIFRTWNGKRIT